MLGPIITRRLLEPFKDILKHDPYYKLRFEEVFSKIFLIKAKMYTGHIIEADPYSLTSMIKGVKAKRRDACGEHKRIFGKLLGTFLDNHLSHKVRCNRLFGVAEKCIEHLSRRAVPLPRITMSKKVGGSYRKPSSKKRALTHLDLEPGDPVRIKKKRARVKAVKKSTKAFQESLVILEDGNTVPLSNISERLPKDLNTVYLTQEAPWQEFFQLNQPHVTVMREYWCRHKKSLGVDRPSFLPIVVDEHAKANHLVLQAYFKLGRTKPSKSLCVASPEDVREFNYTVDSATLFANQFKSTFETFLGVYDPIRTQNLLRGCKKRFARKAGQTQLKGERVTVSGRPRKKKKYTQTTLWRN